jgi:hypothetical protein
MRFFERFKLYSLECRRYSIDSKLVVDAVSHDLILRDTLAVNNRDYESIFRNSRKRNIFKDRNHCRKAGTGS